MKNLRQFVRETIRQKLNENENLNNDLYPTSACILTNKEGKTLILLRGGTAPWMPNKWALPGGGIDEGENPKIAATRESEEEIGLTPNNLVFLKKINYSDYTLYLFRGLINQEPILNFEHEDYAFIDKSEIDNFDFIPNLKSILKDYL